VTVNLIDRVRGMEGETNLVDAAVVTDVEPAAAAVPALLFDPLVVRKNASGDGVGPRGRLNLVEGSNVTITVTDDEAAGEVDVEIAASGGGSVPQLYIDLNAEAGAAAADTNAPATARFWCNSHRHVRWVDLTNYTEVKFQVNRQATNGAAGYTLELRYHTAFATTVGTYSQIGTSAVSVNCVTANTWYETGWIALTAGAKAGVWLAIQASGGDGALDPTCGAVVAVFR